MEINFSAKYNFSFLGLWAIHKFSFQNSALIAELRRRLQVRSTYVTQSAVHNGANFVSNSCRTKTNPSQASTNHGGLSMQRSETPLSPEHLTEYRLSHVVSLIRRVFRKTRCVVRHRDAPRPNRCTAAVCLYLPPPARDTSSLLVNSIEVIQTVGGPIHYCLDIVTIGDRSKVCTLRCHEH